MLSPVTIGMHKIEIFMYSYISQENLQSFGGSHQCHQFRVFRVPHRSYILEIRDFKIFFTPEIPGINIASEGVK